MKKTSVPDGRSPHKSAKNKVARLATFFTKSGKKSALNGWILRAPDAFLQNRAKKDGCLNR